MISMILGTPTEGMRLALKIADSCARSDIECNLTPVEPYPEAWYDERTADADCREDLADAVRYLELRGQLERKPGEPHIIRPRTNSSTMEEG